MEDLHRELKYGVHAIGGLLKNWESRLRTAHAKTGIPPTWVSPYDDKWTFIHTALYKAGSSGSNLMGVIDFYLKRGVDINAQTGKGKTALHIAVDVGNPNAVRGLLKRGIRSDIRDEHGMTAFDVAKAREMKDVLKIFHAERQSPARGLAEVSVLATAPPLREGESRRQLPHDVVDSIGTAYLGLKEKGQAAKGRRKTRRRMTRRRPTVS
jgi:hypothetical protein